MLVHLRDYGVRAVPVIQVGAVRPLKFTEELLVERGVRIGGRSAAAAAENAAPATTAESKRQF